jgi:hypothetical protein
MELNIAVRDGLGIPRRLPDLHATLAIASSQTTAGSRKEELAALLAELGEAAVRVDLAETQIENCPDGDNVRTLDAEFDALYFNYKRIAVSIQTIPSQNIAMLRMKARATQIARKFDPEGDCHGPGSYRYLAAAVVEELLCIETGR